MTVEKMAEKLGLEPCNESGGSDNTVTGCYIGDVLSLAMLRIKRGEVWVTVQKDINVSAVAYMTGVAAIIAADGTVLDSDAAESAADRNIPVFRSEKSAYELAAVLSKIL